MFEFIKTYKFPILILIIFIALLGCSISVFLKNREKYGFKNDKMLYVEGSDIFFEVRKIKDKINEISSDLKQDKKLFLFLPKKLDTMITIICIASVIIVVSLLLKIKKP